MSSKFLVGTYRGYDIYWVEKVGMGRFFYVIRPNGTYVTNTLFYEPGKAFIVTRPGLASALRVVRKAIRRDRRGSHL